MQHRFITSKDGTRLHVARVEPKGARVGSLVVVHGLAEHHERYRHVADLFSSAGFAITIPELRGHGDSEGRRGHVARWQDYVDDLEAVVALDDEPPWFLAHSMGGLVTLDYLLAGGRAEGAVLTNPLLGVAVEAPRWKTALAGALSRAVPWLPIANELDPALLTHDEAVVEAYQEDPRVFKTITPRWFTEMEAARARVFHRAAEITAPLLLVTSSEDRVCAPEASRSLLSSYGGPSEGVHHEGLYHEVMNELEKDRVLAGMLSWLQAQLPRERGVQP